jgi:RNA recognition motif-containing protein
VVQDYNGLRQLFLQHGTVKNVTVPCNPMNAIPRGFAFVTLSSAEEAEKGARPPTLIALLGRTLTPHSLVCWFGYGVARIGRSP